MGNRKISFTAELAALIKSKDNEDKFSKYFVSKRATRRHNLISKVFPKKYIGRIFQRRINLSKKIKSIISKQKPSQIIELAS